MEKTVADRLAELVAGWRKCASWDSESWYGTPKDNAHEAFNHCIEQVDSLIRDLRASDDGRC